MRNSSLRLVKHSQPPDHFDVAKTQVRFPRGTPAPQLVVAAPKPDAPPNATLLGMVPFPAAPDATIIDMPASGRLAAAIAKVKIEAEAEKTTDKVKPFEDIGLPPPKPATRAAQKLVVSSYRLLGFGILTMIVLVLVAYIAQTAFYFMSHTWVTPIAISPSDDRVVALQAQLATQENERAKIAGDLDQAERAIAAEQAFQLEFAQAIRKDAEGRKLALGRVRQLSHAAAATRAQIRATNGEYSTEASARMKQEYDAGLIDRSQMLAGKYQAAQITSASLSLVERQAEFDQRAAELGAETQSLDAILADKATTAAMSYDVLKIQRDYDASKLQLGKDMADRDRLRTSLARQDKIVDGLRNSAYLKALADHATVALVPYTNLDHVAAGTKLYACKVSMLWCHEVGNVIAVLPGEVQVKNPHRDQTVRGSMIEMQMTDNAAAQDEVLFAGGAPLGI